MSTYCAHLCHNPFPGEQVWICSEPAGHAGSHREGNVSWSGTGTFVPDRHSRDGVEP